MAEAQKLKIFTFTEFIDTDGHGFGCVVIWVGSWVQIFTMVRVGLAWFGHFVDWVVLGRRTWTHGQLLCWLGFRN